MLNRRKYLWGSLAAGIVTRCGDYFANEAKDRIQAALKQTVGSRENVAGTVAVVIDEVVPACLPTEVQAFPTLQWILTPSLRSDP